MDVAITVLDGVAKPWFAILNLLVWGGSMYCTWLLSQKMVKRNSEIAKSIVADYERNMESIADIMSHRNSADEMSLTRFRTATYLSWMDNLQAQARGVGMLGLMHKIPVQVWCDAEIDLSKYLTDEELEGFGYGMAYAEAAGDARIQEWAQKFVGYEKRIRL